MKLLHAERGEAPEQVLARADKALGRLVSRVGPFSLKQTSKGTLFAALAESIVYQQLSGKAAKTIHDRVCALFPNRKRGFMPEDILRTSEAVLRGAGLSRSKWLSLRDLSERTEAGQLPTLAQARRMGDEELVSTLTSVRGIGRWTVQMLLMFRLGRMDVLPTTDYGIRKGFQLLTRAKELPLPDAIDKRGERWRPYRSVASWYLWRALELSNG